MGISPLPNTSTSCLRTLAERDAASDYLALRIRKIGPPIGDIHPGPSDIPTRDMSSVVAYVLFVFENTRRAGCGLGLPRIAHLCIQALKLASASCRDQDSRIRYYHRPG